jgi:hypothetical protein
MCQASHVYTKIVSKIHTLTRINYTVQVLFRGKPDSTKSTGINKIYWLTHNREFDKIYPLYPKGERHVTGNRHKIHY